MYVCLKDRFRTSLKYYRFKKKLSQEQLAELCDLTDKYISDIERGRYICTFETAEKIALALGLDPLDLLSDKYYKEYKDSTKKIDEIRGRVKRN